MERMQQKRRNDSAFEWLGVYRSRWVLLLCVYKMGAQYQHGFYLANAVDRNYIITGLKVIFKTMADDP